MRLHQCLAALSVAAVFACAVVGAEAQRNTSTMPPGQHTTSRMGGLFGHHGARPTMGSGRIVGNKNTKVYHMPGDKGNMPEAKNSVYFRTEREAMAAGYHRAGSTRTTSHSTSRMSGGMRHTMNGGSRMNGSGGHLQK